MLRFYPDKPWDRSPDDIKGWDKKGIYVCQQKIDGWRAVIILGKDTKIFSRHNKDLTPSIEPELLEEIESLREHLPSDSVIDSEWLSRRSCSKEYKLSPKLYVFDMMRNGSLWLTTKTYEYRFNLLKNCMNKLALKNILIPPEAASGKFADFYEEQKRIIFSEGIVVKAKSSTLVADRNECKKNPQWFKVRYREASDGKMNMDFLR